MFLKKHNGNMVAKFTVLLIIAVIMITFVSLFGVKILSIFTPDPDKSSIQSFDMVNTVINGVMASNLDYDSETLGIYLAKNYEMILFYEPTLKCKNNPIVITDADGKNPQILESDSVYYAPTQCGNLKCLCLYDDDPVDKEQKRDKHVVKCHTFKEENYKININHEYFDLNDGVCGRDKIKKYSSLIIAKRKANETTANEEKGKEYLYIMKDDAANRQLDADWSVPMCYDSQNLGGICNGRSGDSVVTPSSEDEANQIYQYCLTSESVPYKSTHVICEYEKTTGKCIINCKAGDITNKCHTTFSYCSDFNQDRGVNNEKYIDLNNNYENYILCSKDVDFCNLGCQVSNWNTYICKDSVSGAITGTSCNLAPDCKGEFLADTGVFKDFLKSYDDTVEGCKDFVDEKFYSGSDVLECTEDILDCKAFVLNNRVRCSLKYINYGDIYWITYYGSSCELDVKNLFDKAYFCTDKPQTP